MPSESSLNNPLTSEEVQAANAESSDLWIHVRCKQCGDVECCFNRTWVAWGEICFPCLMGWTVRKDAMEPYQERVVTEKSELDAKIAKLETFFSGSILPTLPEREQERLSRQLGYMRRYSQVLEERIAAF